MRALQRILILLLISIPAVAQIGAKVQQQGKIYGLWQNNQFTYQMVLLLNSDGSGEFDGESIKFKTQGNTLSIAVGGTTTDYSIKLQGNSLTLSGGDLDGRLFLQGMRQPLILGLRGTSILETARYPPRTVTPPPQWWDFGQATER